MKNGFLSPDTFFYEDSFPFTTNNATSSSFPPPFLEDDQSASLLDPLLTMILTPNNSSPLIDVDPS